MTFSAIPDQTPAEPLVDEPAHRTHVRSPVDVLRLIIGAGLVIVGIGTANLLDSALLGLSEDGASAIEDLPAWMRDLPGSGMAVAVVAAITAVLVWSLITTRFRRFAMLVLGFAAAAGSSVLIGELILRVLDDSVRVAFTDDVSIFRYASGNGKIHPGDPLLAGAVAMLGVASSFLRHSIAVRVGGLIAGYGALSVLSSGVPAVGLVADVGAGLFVASAILLVFGRHDLAPDANEVRLAVASVGLDLTSVDHLAVDARGSAPWIGSTQEGSKVFIKALGRDERSADLMFRAYRWIRLRGSGDHRPFMSLRRAVEHEALVSLQAAALGIRTPMIYGVAEAGVDGMVLAYEAVDGGSADTLQDIDDDVLVSIWSMVSELHRKRIAHRDLRLANIFLDSNNEPWLIDFGFSELAASDQLLGTDVAELLASTAALVGVERAVAAAHVATGLDELERALPWLQPLALSTATREAIGGDKGLKPIRNMLITQCGVPDEAPVNLQRISAKTVFVVASIGLSAWFLIPQLADLDSIWQQSRDGSVTWALVAVLFSLLTYMAATGALLGAIPNRLRYGPALLAQIASSFANRVTPAKVGGIATNIRYLQKNGVPTAVSVTAVGLNTIAGLIMHVLLMILFLFLSSGSESSAGLPIPSPRFIALAILAILGLVVLSASVGPTRRLLKTHVLPQLRTGWASIKIIGRSPSRLALLFGGSAVITLAYLGAMVASLEAFGSTAALPVIALLFLTGSAVANAAPTPGGLGAAEAALIAVLSTVEDIDVVIPAVFLFRLVTFWLPILPGWLALTWLRHSDNI